MMKIRSRVLAAIASVCLLYLNAGSVAMGGTLLPPGEQTFFDNNGLPLSSGCVFFYTPGTTSAKTTYQNAAQTIANTNPVQLDAAGRAIIYGTGTYRQIVASTGPNSGSPCTPAGATIWDQLTASTDSSATIFAGASSGTPNAITVVAPAFSGTDGQVINYISTTTNTGGATINPSGFGAVQIVRDSSTGPQALTGGELVATNAVSLIYDATAGTFHILSPVTWPNTSGVPVGTALPIFGFTAPTGYAFAYGQAVSRTTYANLMTAITSAQTASLSSGSPTITGLSDTTQFARGQPIEAIGIDAGTTIQSCTSSACTLSANATATRSGTVTVFPYGNGDGSTTFNLPDMRGRTVFGRDNLGGTAANNSQIATTLTTTSTSTSATVGSATGLAIGMSINGNSNVAPGTTISAISGTTITLSGAATGTQSNVGTRFSVFPDAQGVGIAGGTPTSSLVTANTPAYTPSGSISASITSILFAMKSASTSGSNDFSSAAAATSAGTGLGQYSLSLPGGVVAAAFTGSANGGASIPFSNVPNALVINWAVRLTP